MRDERLGGCFKGGCFGCLGLFALGVGIVMLIGVLQLTVERDEPTPTERQIVRPLPGLAPADLPAELPDVMSLPEDPGQTPSRGRVVIDVSLVELVVSPGPAGEPVRLDADYDTSNFTLDEKLTETDDGWVYKLSFGPRQGFFGILLGAGNNPSNRLELTLPRGYPIDLVGDFGMGETEADLGGLWLGEVDIRFGIGEHFVEFREPTREPIDSLRLDGSLGDIEVRSVGNASPRTVNVDHGMGELFLDLEGAWRNDAEVDVDFGVGECRLWLPEQVRVDVERAEVGIGEKRIDRPSDVELAPGAPTLALRLSGNVGEARIER